MSHNKKKRKVKVKRIGRHLFCVGSYGNNDKETEGGRKNKGNTPKRITMVAVTMARMSSWVLIFWLLQVILVHQTAKTSAAFVTKTTSSNTAYCQPSSHRYDDSCTTSLGGSSSSSSSPDFFNFNSNSDNNDMLGEEYQQRAKKVQEAQDQRRRNALVDALFTNDGTSSSSRSLVNLNLVGQARLSVSTNRTMSQSKRNTNLEQAALVLSSGEQKQGFRIGKRNNKKMDKEPKLSLLLPIASLNQLKLVSFAAAKRPLSKSVMLGLNTIFVNREGGLFDNLPWTTWTVDPQKRNRDAAGNPIYEEYHMGKRDAYNRFMGKDWQGRSLAIGNMALRLKYMLEGENDNVDGNDDGIDDDSDVDEIEMDQKSLAIRVLQLQIRESEMDLAGVESDLAVARMDSQGDYNDDGDSFSSSSAAAVMELERQQSKLQDQIENYKNDLQALLIAKANEDESTKTRATSVISNILDRIAQWSNDDGKNLPPYRGAMGYAPMLDTKEDIDDSLLPYTSPYDLLKEIIEDQLNARVIGCVLENTSLLKGNLALGGAIILQRITPTRKVSILGEEVEVKDYGEDYGNEGVRGEETIIVECDGDEAVAVALTCDVPIKVESDIFNRAKIKAAPILRTPVDDDGNDDEDLGSGHIMDVIPGWKCVDPDMKLQVEGEATEESATTSPVSIPYTTTSLFDSIFEQGDSSSSSSSSSRNQPMYPTDNPIQSLDQLDSLSNEEKAKTLLEMSNFSGKLPRPRVVRTAATKNDNPLDKLLVPLIDESVRRQYLIRQAENDGDTELVNELKSQVSQRQRAKENAGIARANGDDELAEQWDEEAELLASLRADVTQDVGSYNRFLDRDYWYEKDRQAAAKRAKKSSFGTLLDGIE